MVLSAYQINNVLRVYSEQLRQLRISGKPKSGSTSLPGKINTLAQAKRKTIMDKLASTIIERIAHYGAHHNIEKEPFQKLKDQHRANLESPKGGQNELIFKVIDENGETMNSLSVEDSRFLQYNLEEIAKDTVDKNMSSDDELIPYEINKQLPRSTPNVMENPDAKTLAHEQKAEGIRGPDQNTIVNISKTSQKVRHIKELISSEPDIREDKVSALKERIVSGRYRIDHNRVADKLVDAFLDELV